MTEIMAHSQSKELKLNVSWNVDKYSSFYELINKDNDGKNVIIFFESLQNTGQDMKHRWYYVCIASLYKNYDNEIILIQDTTQTNVIQLLATI